jgi:methylase of polypeptide subunit release factors
MKIETMRGLILRQFQIIEHGLDLGMGSNCIGITARKWMGGCRIGIDTNIEAC